MNKKPIKELPFWESKALTDLNEAEWESLCDNCGKCCLNKLENDDGDYFFTNVVCTLYDYDKNCCSEYCRRSILVPDCVKLTPDNIPMLGWMPKTCAYRLVHEGKKLPKWHPLISGNQQSVYDAGAGISHRSIKEEDAGLLEHHIVDWDDL